MSVLLGKCHTSLCIHLQLSFCSLVHIWHSVEHELVVAAVGQQEVIKSSSSALWYNLTVFVCPPKRACLGSRCSAFLYIDRKDLTAWICKRYPFTLPCHNITLWFQVSNLLIKETVKLVKWDLGDGIQINSYMAPHTHQNYYIASHGHSSSNSVFDHVFQQTTV